VPVIHLLISALCDCGLFVFLFLLTFPICSFPSSFFMRLTFSSISSSISYLPGFQNIDPLRFQAGGRRRRPNLGLVCIMLLLAVFLVKDNFDLDIGMLVHLDIICVKFKSQAHCSQHTVTG